MTTTPAPLTIDALAEQMTRQFAAMQVEIDTLRQENAKLRADHGVSPAFHAGQSTHSEPQRDASPLERLSRRWLLRRGLQVAAATAAAGVLAQRNGSSARAGHTGDAVYADIFWAHSVRADQEIDGPAVSATTTSASYGAVEAKNFGTGPGVYAESASANGAIEGKSLNVNGSGVWGSGRTGVVGVSSHGGGSGIYGTNSNNVGVLGEGTVGVKGTSSVANYTAVVGEHTGTVGYGVLGVGKGAGIGVLGRNAAGEGVRGEGQVGVKGTSSTANYTAVVGEHTGTVGYGVLGVGKGGSGVGVLGRNTVGEGVRGEGQVGVIGRSSTANYTAVVGEHTGSVGYGVLGQGTGSAVGVLGRNGSGQGVRGEGRVGVFASTVNSNGYGAVIQGGKAQLRIVPRTTAGKPTSGTHAKGELVLDSAAALWICTVGGTPGTWRKFTTAPA